MKPPVFSYLRPDCAEAALSALADHGEDARLLAGGQSLVPLLNLRMARPSVLIDLNRCAELGRIERRDGELAFGAMVRQMAAETAPDTLAFCPLISQALAHAGPVAVRNRGTVGGTIAHADRTAELPAVAVTLGAQMVIDGVAGRRTVPADEFFLGDLSTAVNPGEMLREIAFPVRDEDSFSVFVESGNRQRDMALAGLAAYFVGDRDGGCRVARCTVIGVEPAPVRLSAVERLLVEEGLKAEAVAPAMALAEAAVDPVTDAHAHAGYRRRLVAGLVARAVEQAMTHYGRYDH